jgi:hypothetical protein
MIVIIIILLFLYIFFNYFYIIDNFYTNNKTDKINEDKNDKDDIDNILLIGKYNGFDNSYLFKYNDKIYKNNDDDLIESSIMFNNFNYLKHPITIPFDKKTWKLKIKLVFNDYKYVGIISNKWYHQEYLLYEKELIDDVYEKDSHDKLYSYLLINIIDNEYKIIYDLPPREKIIQGQQIWFSYGSFQVGPLILK